MISNSLLLKAWDEWDVRGMVLSSLILQVILSVLGNRRKYRLNLLNRTILWLAYLGADWIAIATLGNLSSSYVRSTTTNVLRALWAPLLLLHLGGSDTITAYAYEDNKLWIRHLLILVVKAILVVYVICVSWTPSWISFLSLPLILAGFTKYVERILCLKLNDSQETYPIISISPQQNPFFNPLLKKLPANGLRGFLLFTFMRPDVNDYLSTLSNSNSAGIKIKKYLQESSASIDFLKSNIFSPTGVSSFDFLDMVAYEMTFIFDNVYTKASLICTTYGWLLRLTRFACTFLVLPLFLIGIKDRPKFHFSRVDIHITCILLGGAVMLELYAAWVMLLSDWALLVGIFHHNVFVRKMFWFLLKLFQNLLFRRKKTWSHKMGQFDLLNYCFRCKKGGVNKKGGILQKNIENCQILKSITFEDVPPYLRSFDTYWKFWDSSTSGYAFRESRGERVLLAFLQFDSLKWSIEMDFDYSIIIWHLATTVCWIQEDDHDDNDARKISRCISKYMMYLLVKRPNLLLHEHNKSFWLDHTYDKLKQLLFSATDIKNAASTLVPPNILEMGLDSSFGDTELENLLKNASKLASHLSQLEDKWEMIKAVWMEMLFYAAYSSQQISHIKQLGEDIEFLSLLWLSGGIAILRNIDEAT